MTTISSIYKDLVNLRQSIEEDPFDTELDRKASEIYKRTLVYQQQISWNTLICEAPANSLIDKSIELISHPYIQGRESLKKQLSLICSFFSQLTSAQCLVQDRKLYVATITQWQSQLPPLFSSLTEREVSTKFHLECTTSAIGLINKGAGKWRELAKKHTIPLIVGILKSVADRSPSPIIQPVVNLGQGIYQEVATHSWYQTALNMQFVFSEVKEPADLDKAKEGSSLKNSATQYLEKDIYGLCLGEIFWRIIQDPSTSPELKKRVLYGPTQNDIPSLKDLAEIKRPNTSLSKVRCQCVGYFHQLSKDLEYANENDSIQSVLADRFIKERDPTVHKLLLEIFHQNKTHQIWIQKLTELDITKMRGNEKKFLDPLYQKKNEILQNLENARKSLMAPPEASNHAAYVDVISEEELEEKKTELRRYEEELKNIDQQILSLQEKEESEEILSEIVQIAEDIKQAIPS